MKIGIIGLGMIGGSLALAAQRAGWTVVGYDAQQPVTAAALADKTINAAAASLDEVAAADLVCIAVPVCSYQSLLSELADRLRPDGVLTDVGSTKSDIVRLAQQHLGARRGRFVAAHPIAGQEKSGLAAADADLFDGRMTVLCDDTADEDAAAAVADFWRTLGARIIRMPAEEHDRIFAFISHLPHLLAYALVRMIGDHPDKEMLLQHAAGGFRDFTRIAGSDPTMWRDICLVNEKNIGDALDLYQQELTTLAGHIRQGDGDALRACFADARQLRRQWLETLEK